MNEKQTVRVGCAAFIVNDNGEFLVSRRIGKHGYGTWGLCGGHQEVGETPTETVSREHMEEVGLDIPASDFTPLGFCNDLFPDSGKHYITLFYGATMPSAQAPTILEEDVLAELRWVAFEDMPSPLFQPLETFVQQHESIVRNFIEQVRVKNAA